MNAAQEIRSAVAGIALMREAGLKSPDLGNAVVAVKRFHARRFAGTYSDLLVGGKYQSAACYFLDELYSDKDYAERDAQFARIAGAVQRLFPPQVVALAVDLAKLHALTESLDHAMAKAWLELSGERDDEARHYVAAWQATGCRSDRENQLAVVMKIGAELAHLTRTPGLRLMLKMMRAPAGAAGLSSLQRFLEAGFDTFAMLARQKSDVESFLTMIRLREKALIDMLFDQNAGISGARLKDLLAQSLKPDSR